MAKRIIEMVRAKRDAIAGDHAAADRLGKMAIAAINDGVKSRAWERFMLEFVEKDPNNPTRPLDSAQLARLLGEDDASTNEETMEKRAYLVSNATCGAGSPDTFNLALNVNSIDEGLGLGCEAVANTATSSGADENAASENAAQVTQRAGGQAATGG